MERIVEQLKHIMDHLVRFDVIHLGPITITSTVINTWIVMVLLFGLVFLVTRGGFHEKPRGAQAAIEMLVEFLYGLLEGAMGKEGRRYLWIVGSLFVFILVLNLSWFIPGFIPPTTDIMTTAALAVTTIVIVQIMGIKKKGLGGYLHHFTQPVAIMLPMNIIEEIVKPFSLAIRLFGNMFGEKTVVTILGVLVPLFLPVPIMLLGLLMGGIQAFIFTLLTVTYLATQTHGH
ncbi:MAG: F0F1 ATP synthase subunit A [Firmicutes bacterium]|nr:F0F1 ATP synthase subunit A [Bacillota bacterium]